MNLMTASAKPDPAPSTATATGRDAVRLLESIIEPVVETMGFSLCHLEWAGQPGRRTLRVFLDHERGVNLDDCTRLNRIVGNALDAAEVAPGADRVARLLAGAYTLEVSSPGIERPLSRRSHFERFVGRRVTIKTHAPLREDDKQRTFHGWIESAEPDASAPDDDHEGSVVLRDDAGQLHRIGIEQIRRANLVYDADNGAPEEGHNAPGRGRNEG